MGLLDCSWRIPVKRWRQNGRSAAFSPLGEPGQMWQAARVDTASDLRFAIALFDAAAGTADSNYLCSPWSVASALAALAPGTTADARDEIATAVGAPDRLRHEVLTRGVLLAVIGDKWLTAADNAGRRRLELLHAKRSPPPSVSC